MFVASGEVGFFFLLGCGFGPPGHEGEVEGESGDEKSPLEL